AVEVLFDTDSTNKAVLAVDPLDSAALCVAEKQSSGRGRQGREWSSPLGRSLYFSLRYPFKLDDYARLSLLSLQVGMDLVEVLRAFGIDANLKWPALRHGGRGRPVGSSLLPRLPDPSRPPAHRGR